MIMWSNRNFSMLFPAKTHSPPHRYFLQRRNEGVGFFFTSLRTNLPETKFKSKEFPWTDLLHFFLILGQCETHWFNRLSEHDSYSPVNISFDLEVIAREMV